MMKKGREEEKRVCYDVVHSVVREIMNFLQKKNRNYFIRLDFAF